MAPRRRSPRPVHRLVAVGALGLLAAGTAGCTAGSGTSPGRSSTSAASSPAQPAPSRGTHRPAALVVAAAPWRLAQPLSRAVALAVGGRVLVIGGLRTDGTSTAAVEAVDPSSGRISRWGELALPAHDAAGAMLRGAPLLLGGGADSSYAAVQRLTAGHTAARIGSLPVPRSDLSAVSAGDRAYVLGGYDGSRWQGAVLRTADGIHFSAVATLPVPVRYTAAAVAAGSIWLFGGQATTGPTAAVQRIDLATGAATVAGRLPGARTDATALALGGAIYVCGGRVDGRFSDQVLRFDPGTRRFAVAGRLPAPVGDAAGVVLGDVGYLLGGEKPAVTDTATTLRLGTGAP